MHLVCLVDHAQRACVRGLAVQGQQRSQGRRTAYLPTAAQALVGCLHDSLLSACCFPTSTLAPLKRTRASGSNLCTGPT